MVGLDKIPGFQLHQETKNLRNPRNQEGWESGDKFLKIKISWRLWRRCLCTV